MKLTGFGKLTLLILALGAAGGGWKWWNNRMATQGGVGSTTGAVSRTTGGATATTAGDGGTGEATTTEPGTASPATAGTTDGSGGSETGIKFIITAAKKDWIQEQVDRFNLAHPDTKIATTALASRKAMHDILKGKEQPVLWSPGSPIWPTRLAEAWSQAGSSGKILDMSDANGYRVYLRSPLVFLTTKQKAVFLRPLLGGSNPWAALRSLSIGEKKTPWGSFRFAHADPLTSSSGMLTLGLALVEYGDKVGQSDRLDTVATSAGFRTWMKEMERSLVYDDAAQKGTTALTKAYLADPSSYDVITAYESSALEAAPGQSDLAVIYPSPTAVAEHSVSLLSGPWVSDKQKQGAAEFLNFLGSKEALRDGLKYHFRPMQAGGDLSLNGELSRFGGQGFKQSYTNVELPSYKALNDAAFQWRIHVAHKPPTDDDK